MCCMVFSGVGCLARCWVLLSHCPMVPVDSVEFRASGLPSGLDSFVCGWTRSWYR